MTKGRAALPFKAVAEMIAPFIITDSSTEKHFHEGSAELRIPLPKGFEPTWAGPFPGRVFCFGSEAGELLFTNEHGSAYRDETAQELRTLLEAKLQGRSPAEEPAPMVLPLLEALQQSVAAVQDAEPSPPRPQTRSPRKRSRRPA